MEDNKNTNTEVIETGAGTETPAVDNNKTDEELFAKFDEICIVDRKFLGW